MQDSVASTTLGAAWPEDRAHQAIIAGAVIVFIFFGVLGTWAALARLDAAAIAPAVIRSTAIARAFSTSKAASSRNCA